MCIMSASFADTGMSPLALRAGERQAEGGRNIIESHGIMRQYPLMIDNRLTCVRP